MSKVKSDNVDGMGFDSIDGEKKKAEEEEVQYDPADGSIIRKKGE